MLVCLAPHNSPKRDEGVKGNDGTSRRSQATKLSKEATQEKGHWFCIEHASALSYYGYDRPLHSPARFVCDPFKGKAIYQGTNRPAIQRAKKMSRSRPRPSICLRFAPLLLPPSGFVVSPDPNKTIHNSNTKSTVAPRHTAQTVPAHSSTQVTLCPEIQGSFGHKYQHRKGP